MLDRTKIGHEFAPFTAEVETGRLKFFAKAIGETDPIYTDEAVARAAGYRALPAPPTFLAVMDTENPEPLPVLTLLNLDIGRVLHGTQEFEYLGDICAGDRVTVTWKIIDMFDKKDGALEFVVSERTYTNDRDQLVAKTCQTLIYRNA